MRRPSRQTDYARGVFSSRRRTPVLAGLDVALEAFRQLDATLQVTLRRDGDACSAGDVIAEVVSSARKLLVGERTAITSFPAALGHRHARAPVRRRRGRRITVLDTRATTPTLRALGERDAVATPAVLNTNHRIGPFDAVLIKDNHLRLAGGVPHRSRRTPSGGAGDGH